jgi:hypothetical protein
MFIHSQRSFIGMLASSDTSLKPLADPMRRANFEHVCRKGEQTVGALTIRAKVSQPAVSRTP